MFGVNPFASTSLAGTRSSEIGIGWTAYPAGSLDAAIDETSPDDADYIVSPDINVAPSPFIAPLVNPINSGDRTFAVRCKRIGSVGMFKLSFYDSAGSLVGASSWTDITGGETMTTYNIAISLSGTATSRRVDVYGTGGDWIPFVW